MQRMQRQGVWSMIFAEEISLSEESAAGVVRQLIVDASTAGRPHRGDLFNPLLKYVGIGCGPNKAYRRMCVIDLSGAPVPR